MNQRKNHIDKIFKRKLRHWSQEPPADIWDNISAELDLSRRKKRIVWIARIAASVAVITVLTLSYVIIRNSADRALVTEEQVSKDSVMKEQQVVPEYAVTGDTGDKEPGRREDLSGKETIQYEEQAVIEEQEMVAEISSSEDAEHPESDVLHRPYDISGSSLAGSELAYLDMNYINHLDYTVPHRERKPERYDKSHYLPVLTEPTTDADWDELIVQNVPDEENKIENRWAVGTQVSPIYSYRTLGLKESGLESNSYYDQIESGLVTYSGGVNVKYLPSKRISIQSGVYYSKLGLTIDHHYFSSSTPTAELSSWSVHKYNAVSNSSGSISFEDADKESYITNYGGDREQTLDFSSVQELNVRVYEGEIIQNFEYLEVPMIVRFKMVDRKLDLNLLGGMSTNFLIGSNAYFLEDGSKEKIGRTSGIKPVNYSSILGFGVGYAISKRLNINLEPTFRYYLNSINESSSIRSHPYSLGIFTGMSFYF